MDALKELGSMMEPEYLSMKVFEKPLDNLDLSERKVLLSLMEKINVRIQEIDLIPSKRNGGIVSLDQLMRPLGVM